MTHEEQAAQAKADEIFDELDDYGRWTLYTGGTAFTTYEDYGPEVCAFLNARARSWYCTKATKEERA